MGDSHMSKNFVLKLAIEYATLALGDHLSRLGESTPGNKRTAEIIRQDIDRLKKELKQEGE